MQVTVRLEEGISQEEAAEALTIAAARLKRNTIVRAFSCDQDIMFIDPDTNKKLGWMYIRGED